MRASRAQLIESCFIQGLNEGTMSQAENPLSNGAIGLAYIRN
jgi:hypothetical protein